MNYIFFNEEWNDNKELSIPCIGDDYNTNTRTTPIMKKGDYHDDLYFFE